MGNYQVPTRRSRISITNCLILSNFWKSPIKSYRISYYLTKVKSQFLIAAQFRRHLHKTFLLRCDQPFFRRMNKYLFEDDKPKSGPLINVHVGLKPPGQFILHQSFLVSANFLVFKNENNFSCHVKSSKVGFMQGTMNSSVLKIGGTSVMGKSLKAANLILVNLL